MSVRDNDKGTETAAQTPRSMRDAEAPSTEAAKPLALPAQLKDGGRLVCVRGSKPPTKAYLYRHIEGELSGRPIFDATTPALPGFAEKPAFVF